jgi:hypothetical protein
MLRTCVGIIKLKHIVLDVSARSPTFPSFILFMVGVIPSVTIGAIASMMKRVKTCFYPRLKLLLLIGVMAPTGMGT